MKRSSTRTRNDLLLVATGLLAAAVIGLAAGCGGEERDDDDAAETALTTPTAADAGSTPNLEDIVVSSPPRGTTQIETSTGPSAVFPPVRTASSATQTGVQERLVDARLHVFAAEDGRFLGSFVAAYEDPDAASAAMQLFLDHFRTGWQYKDAPQRLGLGDEGAVFSGNTPMADVQPGRTYIWRDGALLLHVFAAGPWQADEAQAIAEGMDARADSADAG